MSLVSRNLNTSIGCKVIMSLTGLMLVGFLIAHLAGNLLIFAGAETLNLYSKSLRDYLPILWTLRLGLVFAAFLHVISAIKLTQINRAAKPRKYRVSTSLKASFASKYMGLSGSVVLFFILYHLAHLTFRLTHPEFKQLGAYDAYGMLIRSFQSPVLTILYCFSIVLLMLHLNHGISSLFQTLGFNHTKYNKLLRGLGPALSILLAGGFLSIPLSIVFGFVK